MAYAYSQNGYSANDRSVIAQYVVSDGGRVMNLRKGSPGELLAHMVRWFDKNIRNIDPGIMDDWSYAERPVRGGVELSNHASGTAADVDATKWPLGVTPLAYLAGHEITRLRDQLKLYEGCIRWGGDYAGRKDPMHFEIDRDQAACDRVWAKIGNQTEDDMFEPADRALLKVVADRLRGDTTFTNDSLQRVLEKLDAIDARLSGDLSDGMDRPAEIWQNDNEHAAALAGQLEEIRAQLAEMAAANKPVA